MAIQYEPAFLTTTSIGDGDGTGSVSLTLVPQILPALYSTTEERLDGKNKKHIFSRPYLNTYLFPQVLNFKLGDILQYFSHI